MDRIQAHNAVHERIKELEQQLESVEDELLKSQLVANERGKQLAEARKVIQKAYDTLYEDMEKAKLVWLRLEHYLDKHEVK